MRLLGLRRGRLVAMAGRAEDGPTGQPRTNTRGKRQTKACPATWQRRRCLLGEGGDAGAETDGLAAVVASLLGLSPLCVRVWASSASCRLRRSARLPVWAAAPSRTLNSIQSHTRPIYFVATPCNHSSSSAQNVLVPRPSASRALPVPALQTFPLTLLSSTSLSSPRTDCAPSARPGPAAACPLEWG